MASTPPCAVLTSPVRPSNEMKSPSLTVFPLTRNLSGVFVDLQRACPHDGWLPICLPTTAAWEVIPRGCQNPLRYEHSVYVVGDRLAPHQNHLFALLRPLNGVVGRKDHLSARRTG